MKLGSLFQRIPVLEKIHWDPHRTFRKIVSDSRTLEADDVFVACLGSRMDGHDFLSEAIYAGASAIVFERMPEIAIPPHVTAIRVVNTRACFSMLLNRFYAQPDKQVKLIGVTGTNGKTTVAYLLHRLLSQKTKSAYLGTLWYELPSEKMTAVNTTPGPEVVLPLLADMRRQHVKYCVLEVSSHALEQCRVSDLEFELVIFTQLTQDHLDYHGDFESYFQAKRKLFTAVPQPRQMLINQDCPYGKRLLREMPGAKSYSLTDASDYQVADVQVSWHGSFFNLCYRDMEMPFQIRLPLIHNIANAACVLGALDLLGFSCVDFRGALREIPGIPGRMERVDGVEDFDIFVDYAHTPDAFDHVLRESKKLAKRRILTLFGCGGDRDVGKRPEMTRIACQYSDLVVLTSDNPRSEDPESILADMKKGIPFHLNQSTRILEIPDRQEGIETILSLAEPGDVVLLLGKGHEDYQILGEKKVPFSDRLVSETWLKRKDRVFLS